MVKEKNELIVFSNEELGLEVRCTIINGKEYFVAKDIAVSLGYKDATSAIKQHCKGVVKHHLPNPQNEKKMLEMNMIPEGDMYRLIVRSKLESAQRFEGWVMDEILPQIRKTGGYISIKEGDTKEDIEVKVHEILNKTLDIHSQLESKLVLVTKELMQDINSRVEKLEQQGNENHRMSHKKKLDLNKLIKEYASSSIDRELIKDLTLCNFGVDTWEGVPFEVYPDVINYIKEVCRKINLDEVA